MVAARLRRVGTRGMLVDPGEVAAVVLTHKPPGVAAFLASGVLLQVVEAVDLAKELCDGEDVGKVHHQLTVRAT